MIEKILLILVAVLMVVLIAGIQYYNRLDKLRFRMDRLLKRAKPELDEWVACCEALRPGCGAAYYAAKKNWERTACIAGLIRSETDSSAEKREAEDALRDFCLAYNDLARRYGKSLGGSLGKLAAALRFRRYEIIDFDADADT